VQKVKAKSRKFKETAMTLVPGLTYDLRWTVEERHLASALGSGAAPVFATPAMVALCEGAAFLCVAPQLAAGQTTVGTQITLRHLAATPLGMEVRATANLVEVEGRRLRFTLEVWDEVEKVGEGEHERFIVDGARFLARVSQKQDDQRGA
jgi:fluoroacetyl-CoA thioesterase